jgi:hypothetical protein
MGWGLGEYAESVVKLDGVKRDVALRIRGKVGLAKSSEHLVNAGWIERFVSNKGFKDVTSGA